MHDDNESPKVTAVGALMMNSRPDGRRCCYDASNGEATIAGHQIQLITEWNREHAGRDHLLEVRRLLDEAGRLQEHWQGGQPERLLLRGCSTGKH